ncbi:hypothetical protein ANN_04784 [Periplaneta americana]|uniref:Uncharacterized protein n=1 Tax=Periplaneta americana TaxID=6978 RepID=A0ABQ8TAZ5_PERAM|nr:hypothetical protein ANN_04784 [Periplaneta americana]
MAGLCEGGNEPSGSLKALCKERSIIAIEPMAEVSFHAYLEVERSEAFDLRPTSRQAWNETSAIGLIAIILFTFSAGNLYIVSDIMERSIGSRFLESVNCGVTAHEEPVPGSILLASRQTVAPVQVKTVKRIGPRQLQEGKRSPCIQ